jgi:hypothetical protein
VTRDYKPYFMHDPKLDPKRCKAEVWEQFRSYQCSKKVKLDGYCAQHHPDAEKRRDEQRRAKAEREDRQRRTAWAVDDARAKVVDTALELKIFTDGPEARALQKALDTLRKAMAERQAALEEGL